MHQKQCTAHSGEKRPAASIWKNWVPCVFFCFGTCAIIKHKGKLIPQAKQLPVKIDRVPFKYWINDDYWRSTPPNFHKP